MPAGFSHISASARTWEPPCSLSSPEPQPSRSATAGQSLGWPSCPLWGAEPLPLRPHCPSPQVSAGAARPLLPVAVRATVSLASKSRSGFPQLSPLPQPSRHLVGGCSFARPYPTQPRFSQARSPRGRRALRIRPRTSGVRAAELPPSCCCARRRSRSELSGAGVIGGE